MAPQQMREASLCVAPERALTRNRSLWTWPSSRSEGYPGPMIPFTVVCDFCRTMMFGFLGW